MKAVKLFVGQRIKITNAFVYRLSLLFLTATIIFLMAYLFNVGISFPWPYFLLPIVWMVWILKIVLYETKRDILCVIGSFVIINICVLLLLKMSSINDASFYNAKGTDFFMLIVNFPVMIPFGVIVTYYFFSLAQDFGVCFSNCMLTGYIETWVEIVFCSIFQGLSLFFIRFIYVKCRWIVTGS